MVEDMDSPQLPGLSAIDSVIQRLRFFFFVGSTVKFSRHSGLFHVDRPFLERSTMFRGQVQAEEMKHIVNTMPMGKTGRFQRTGVEQVKGCLLYPFSMPVK